MNETIEVQPEPKPAITHKIDNALDWMIVIIIYCIAAFCIGATVRLVLGMFGFGEKKQVEESDE